MSVEARMFVGGVVGLLLGLVLIIAWFELRPFGDKWSYAKGYEDARVNSWTRQDCDRISDIGTPLLSVPSLDLDEWKDGCYRRAEEQG